jgi:hypothetical protein
MNCSPQAKAERDAETEAVHPMQEQIGKFLEELPSRNAERAATSQTQLEPNAVQEERSNWHAPTEEDAADPPTQEENERYWRVYWHPRLVLLREDAYGKVYQLNKNWASPFVQVHSDFADLLQLFYDLMPVIKQGRMSTSGIHVITNQVIVTVKRITRLDREVLDRYRGRHYLVHSRSYSIGDKINDARKMLAQVRATTPYYRERSSAKQVDALAHAMKLALLRTSVSARREALKSLPNRILIDTRSKQGRPKFLFELPIDPPQGSVAYIEKDFDRWILRICETQEGITPLAPRGAGGAK